VEITFQQFRDELVASGLMTAEEVNAALARLPSDEKPHNGKELAKALVRARRLTKFQAQAVYQGKTRGLVLGSYVILDRLGEGGQGQVYKAWHKTMSRVVALKILPSSARESPEVMRRFRREVKAIARLFHPKIVTAFDAGEAEGVPFLAMEFVDGMDLSTLVRRQGRLPVEKALDYILQAAAGLEYAHGDGVVHRDIKPANLLLDRFGTVKVLDMGLARLHEATSPFDSTRESEFTDTGRAMGTVDYMPPEQALDAKRADERSDIYSLGCTFYYLLTGHAIYQEGTLTQKVIAHREQAVPSLRAERPDVPESLDAAFQRMVAKRPEDRFGSVSEVIAALRQSAASTEAAPTPSSAFSASSESRASAATATYLPKVDIKAEETASEHAMQLTLPVITPLEAVKGREVPPLSRRMIAGLFLGVACLVVLTFALVLTMRSPGGTSSDEVDEPWPTPQVIGRETGAAQPAERPIESAAAIDPSLTHQPTNAPPLAVAPFDAKEAREHQQAWADHLGVPVETTNSIGMQMVLIPPGMFLMGVHEPTVSLAKAFKVPSYFFDSEKPLHRVRITKPIYFGACEVTVGQFRQFVTDSGYNTEAERSGTGGEAYDPKRRKFMPQPELTWKNPGFPQTDSCPVVQISWNDAVVFFEWLSRKEEQRYRLPTEAEWEYACRAGTTTRFYFGDDPKNLHQFGNVLDASARQELPEPRIAASDGYGFTSPVGSFGPNGFGLYDMHGNVWEWCSDWLDFDSPYYPVSATDDPQGPASGRHRALRSGTWYNGPHNCRSASRFSGPPDTHNYVTGFRAVRIPHTGAPIEQEVELQDGVKLTMVLIPAGSFTMGSPDSDPDARDDEKPQHEVNITKPFYLGKYEVTQQQWEAIMGNNPSRFKQLDDPVENVSWEDCQRFIAKLNEKCSGADFYLPTEAQWEYACRAGTTTRFSFGDDAAAFEDYAWFGSNAGGRTKPIGLKKPNPWGLYDMHGNVCEWCADWYDEKYYSVSPKNDPKGPVGPPPGPYAFRVVRGEGYQDPTSAGGVYRSPIGGPQCLRSARRNRHVSDFRVDTWGFRVARACE
jgi:serine/threonine-protein kinase